MSEQSSTGVQQRRIRIKLNEDGRPEFWVRLEVGDWISERIVTVTDDNIDVADLIRRIARGDTGVTEVDRPQGQIVYDEPRGRRLIVGEWHTHESEWGHDSVVTFAFPSERGTMPDVEVDAGEVDTVQFEVEQYQDEGWAQQQQAPAANGGGE